MAIAKKHGKGRLDRWYKLAKEKGYRARAAFKLIQLNRKYGFLERSKAILDLCAAPGSWSQVAAEVAPPHGLIIAVDLAPIKAIPRTICLQEDITSDKCRAAIRGHLKGWKVDTVLHDGAPNVGTAWVQDAYSQAELTLQALKLAADFLQPGGTFVTKVFRSKDYNALLWVFQQLFAKVEGTKPPASRNVSAEIFVVCRDFKAPKHLDPRFTDPRAVFAELAAPAPNHEAKVFNPDKKKRKREGYAEGDYTQFSSTPAIDFIQTSDPIAMLGSLNQLSFEVEANTSLAFSALNALPETTGEIKTYCQDLKLLGRKEFRALLKWRLRARETLGLATRKSNKAPEAVPAQSEQPILNDEEQTEAAWERLKQREAVRKKKERRKENERKQREVVRMQMNMLPPTEIGLEQPILASRFSAATTQALGGSESSTQMDAVTSGGNPNDGDMTGSSHSDSETDDELDRLDEELDVMYSQYKTRKEEARAAREAELGSQINNAPWDGLADSTRPRDLAKNDDDSSDDAGGATHPNAALHASQLSSQARSFFNREEFGAIEGLAAELEPDNVYDEQSMQDPGTQEPRRKPLTPSGDQDPRKPSQDLGREAKHDMNGGEGISSDDESLQRKPSDRHKAAPLDIEMITAEAMTLAQSLAKGEQKMDDVVDDGYNKHQFADSKDLPEWFIDDERKYSRMIRPVTREAAAAIQEKTRALNARPIKKVAEARARKKMKAARRLEKMRQKSSVMADSADMSERDKAQSIEKLLRKGIKKRSKAPVQLVRTRKGSGGTLKRPAKGKRYKLVDARLRKDIRAQKRK